MGQGKKTDPKPNVVRHELTLGLRWTNEQLFERVGDDSQMYFLNQVDQIMTFNGANKAASWDYPANELIQVAQPKPAVIQVAAGQTATTFLCQESDNTRRTLLLMPGANAKVFIDAWKHWQTTPINVQAFTVIHQMGQGAGPSTTRAPYKWELYNYIPMGSSAGKTEDTGVAEFSAPVAMDNYSHVLQTLGHLNRSPSGEYPVSQATKSRACIPNSDRPFLLFYNLSNNAAIEMTVRVTQ